MNIILIAVGGALGALSRYGVDVLAMRLGWTQPFPIGTLGANLIGCFLIGMTAAFVTARMGQDSAQAVHLLVAVGYIGSLTTFSTLALQVHDLLSRDFWIALAYVAVSLVAGVVLVVLGRHAAAMFTGA